MTDGGGFAGGTHASAGSRFPSYPSTPFVDHSPGWYPDPWRIAAYRYWDGRAWSRYVSQRHRSMRVAKIARVGFIVGSAVSGTFLLFWIALFPLILLEGSDNGCAGSNLSRVWLPNVSTLLLATVACVFMAARGIARRSRWWVVLPVTCVVVTFVCMSTLSPIPACR